MVQMTCPVCKNRCLLTVEQNGSDILVQGNKCARGELHAREELEGKGKIVTYHASTCFEQVPSVEVKTTSIVPTELVFRLIRLIKKEKITRPMARGEVLLHHPLGLETDVSSTAMPSSIFPDGKESFCKRYKKRHSRKFLLCLFIVFTD